MLQLMVSINKQCLAAVLNLEPVKSATYVLMMLNVSVIFLKYQLRLEYRCLQIAVKLS